MRLKMKSISASFACGLAALVLLTGCGGGGGGGTASLRVSPELTTVNPGATQAFNPIFSNTGNTAVTWSVQEGAAGGTITSAGVYTAPAAFGTYHVVATSQANTALTATATVTVPLAVSVAPPTPTININETQQFTSVITGSTNTAVTWRIQEGAAGGTITSGGLYTAPGTAGTYHIIVTSQADTTKTATTTVTVQAGSASGTIQ
jgi:hypothetical protein